MKQKFPIVAQPRFHETCNFGFNNKVSYKLCKTHAHFIIDITVFSEQPIGVSNTRNLDVSIPKFYNFQFSNFLRPKDSLKLKTRCLSVKEVLGYGRIIYVLRGNASSAEK